MYCNLHALRQARPCGRLHSLKDFMLGHVTLGLQSTAEAMQLLGSKSLPLGQVSHRDLCGCSCGRVIDCHNISPVPRSHRRPSSSPHCQRDHLHVHRPVSGFHEAICCHSRCQSGLHQDSYICYQRALVMCAILVPTHTSTIWLQPGKLLIGGIQTSNTEHTTQDMQHGQS